MIELLKLGKHYVSDFIKSENDYKDRKKYSLDLILDEKIGAPRLKEVAPAEMMWGQYWYRSGTNQSMTNELKNIVDDICSRIQYKKDDIWLDIACNDGTLLKFVPSLFVKIGIDPADDSFKNESCKIADVIVQNYFSKESYKSTIYGERRAKVITTIAMFYDLDDPNPFISDIVDVLDDDGVWIIQLSYTPLMLKQLAFDNICHEHVYYYSINSLEKLFAPHGLKIVDTQINDTNGGSIRVYIQKDKAPLDSFGTTTLRDVYNFRLSSLREYENSKWNISDPSLWSDFAVRLEDLKQKTVGFIEKERGRGKVICGYGASTKGNSLLQYFGLNDSHISAIAERSAYKFGLKTIGSNIPILPEKEVREMMPDYMLVLPWHFIREFTTREKDFLSAGGKFIVPCPKFEIIGT